MDEERCSKLLEVWPEGEMYQSGGNIWLFVLPTQDGRCVVISDELIEEFESKKQFYEENPEFGTNAILLV